MIEFINVQKAFGEQSVINNFSLRVNDGESVAIIGESGSGKTTLLRLAAGLEMADGGQINKNGKVAFMFQEPRLLPWFTARQNIIAVIGQEYGDIADKYLDAVKLSDDADKYPDQLSGGMAQRVAFARFLAYAEVSDADILMLDEPTAQLDCELALSMISLLIDFAKNKTLIVVTHNSAEAEMLGSTIKI